MSTRTCPDWPTLMELAPELQFKHYTVAEAQLPVEVLTTITHVSLSDVAICCDLEHHVFYAEHTEPGTTLTCSAVVPPAATGTTDCLVPDPR